MQQFTEDCEPKKANISIHKTYKTSLNIRYLTKLYSIEWDKGYLKVYWNFVSTECLKLQLAEDVSMYLAQNQTQSLKANFIYF